MSANKVKLSWTFSRTEINCFTTSMLLMKAKDLLHNFRKWAIGELFHPASWVVEVKGEKGIQFSS